MNAQNTVEPSQVLNVQQQGLVRVSALTAVGDLQNLKTHLNNGLDAKLTVNEIKEALVQLYAYCGFPRSLNAINVFRTVLDERKTNGLIDSVGREIVVENNVGDKYGQGRRVLEVLTKAEQLKPAPGFGEFAPRIDAFLKEHLFGDIFVSDVLTFQQREMVTLAALAAIPGVESQFQSHIGMGMNTGITAEQITGILDIIEEIVGKEQADIARAVLLQSTAIK